MFKTSPFKTLNKIWFYLESFMFLWFPLLAFILSVLLGADLVQSLLWFILFSLIGLGFGLTLHNIRQKGLGTCKIIEHHSFPQNLVKEKLESAKKRIYILTTWLPGDEYFLGVLIEKFEKLDFKIILGDENVIKQRETELSYYHESNRFTQNQKLASTFKNSVIFIDFPPHMLLFIIDNFIIVAPTLFNKQAVEGVALECKESSIFGEELVENFNNLWNNLRRVQNDKTQ